MRDLQILRAIVANSAQHDFNPFFYGKVVYDTGVLSITVQTNTQLVTTTSAAAVRRAN